MSNAESLEQSPDAEVGRRVNMRMWDLHISQTAIAPKLGISQSVMARKLRGQASWSIGQLIAAAHELDTTVAYLVGETDEPGRAENAQYGLVVHGFRDLSALPSNVAVLRPKTWTHTRRFMFSGPQTVRQIYPQTGLGA